MTRSFFVIPFVALLTLQASTASAHTLGVSESELTVDDDGVVHGRLAIPSLELSALAPIDRDGDGRITQAEVDGERAHFDRLVPGLLEIRADGAPCPGALQRLDVGEQLDGVDMFLEYRCPAQPMHVEVQALLLAALPLSHRHTLLLRAGTRSIRVALGGPMRRAELTTGYFRGEHRMVAFSVLAALAAGILWFAWRRRGLNA